MINLKTTTYTTSAGYNTLNWNGTNLLYNGIDVGGGDTFDINIEATTTTIASVNGYLQYNGPTSTSDIVITLDLQTKDIITIFNNSTNKLTVLVKLTGFPNYKYILETYQVVRFIKTSDSVIHISNESEIINNWEFNDFFMGNGGYSPSLLALDHLGQAWSWGYNLYGQLGDNTTVSKSTPVQVCGGHIFCKGFMGSNHNAALKANGELWSWGYNLYGQLGDNTTTSKLTPVQVCGGHTFCKIANSLESTIALDHLGQAWSWGNNQYGTLGDNTAVSKRTPIQVCGGHTFCDIYAGQHFILALDHLGQAWSWGRNFYGELGNNTSSNSISTPVAVCGGHTFCQITSGGYTAYALKANGELWSWGDNTYGYLGNNTTLAKSTPVQVCGGNTFCNIVSGTAHIFATNHLGQIWGWGYGRDGRLADGNLFSCYSQPILLNALSGFDKLVGLNTNSAGIDNNNKLWTWGDPIYGTLGDNLTRVVDQCLPGNILLNGKS